MLYDNVHVATRLIWKDLGRAAYGLDIYCDVPLPWVVWLAFQPQRIRGRVGMPLCHRVAYPGQHQCQARYIIFDGFMILKPICICFKCVPICIMEMSTGGL